LNSCYYHIIPMKHLLHLNKLGKIYHFMSIQPQMWHAYENVFCGFWFCCVAFVVATMVYSFFLHVSTLWLFIPQFVQYLSVFHVLVYVFGGATYLVLCGTEITLLALAIVILFSHNIIASLCYCSVDCFILTITILRYDYKPALNIIVKLSMVGTCCKSN
jgi:hypothetical protein